MVLQTQHYSSCLIRFLFYIQWLEFSGINAEIINGQLFNVNSGRKIQSDYVIDVTSASSRMQCALRCQRRSECAGINFNFQSKQCEICSVPGDPTYIEASSGWDVTTPCGLVSTNGLEVSTAMGHPSDCYDILSQYGDMITGLYSVYVPGTGTWVSVYCDMDTDGGGWTVFQRRQNGDVDFKRDFASYRDGFGEPSNEYWLGLEIIHSMTHGLSNQLQFHFVDFLGQVAYEKYDSFSVEAGPAYQLYLGDLTFFNNTQDPDKTMKYNDGASFTTSDHDADQSSGNCADIHNGGWWFKDCTSVNPNGEYTADGTPSSHSNGLGGLISPGWKGYETLRETKLMFRRK